MKDEETISKIKEASRLIQKSFKYKTYIKEIPAFVYGIIYKGKLVYSEGFGFSDRENRIKVNENSVFRIASISKTFTATAIMQLVEKGKLRLDDKVSDHLDWFKSTIDKNVEKITIRQLLTHTSGIQRDGDTPHWVEHNFPQLEYLKKYVSTLELPIETNTQWKYSNLGFAILGETIKVVSGEDSYESYIKKHITAKLGMSHTSSVLTDEIKSRMVIGRGRKIPGKEREIFPSIETNAYSSATGLSSNLSDLAKFVSSWFKGNSNLLTEESRKELLRVQWINENENYNQAIAFKSWKLQGSTYFSHSGGFPGYRANIAFSRDKNIGVISLMNVIGLDPSVFSKTALHILDKVLTTMDKQEIERKEKDFSKYQGLFRNHWMDIQILQLGNKLIVFDPLSDWPLNWQAEIRQTDKDKFKLISDKWELAGEPVKFELDSTGVARKVILGANPYKRTEI